MTAIAGIIHFDGAMASPNQLRSMLAATPACGPLEASLWSLDGAALGQCRRETDAAAVRGDQPFKSDCGRFVLVMDGWLSNWMELRQLLLEERIQLRSEADEELFMRAFERWGEDCLRHIEGDFVFVIWDAVAGRAFCARDRMGHKVLHYHWNGKSLAFASDVASLLSLDWIAEVPNQGLLAEYLAGEFYTRDETLWQGISRLVSAHAMTLQAGSRNTFRYWEPDLSTRIEYADDRDYVEHYRELFVDLVKRHSRTTGAVAVEVSGGLDSTAVMGVAHHLYTSGKLPASGVEAFTLAFEQGSDADELAFARHAADARQYTLHEVPASCMGGEWYVQQTRHWRDFPGFPNAASFEGLRAAVAGSGHQVLLTGEGGDFWLEGRHAYFPEELWGRRWRNLWQLISQDVTAYGPRYVATTFLRQAIFWQLPDWIQQPLRRLNHRLLARPGAQDTAWLQSELCRQLAHQKEKGSRFNVGAGAGPGQKILLHSLNYAFNAQFIERGGRRAAAMGLELRHPMNHHRFAQFALSTPARIRSRGARPKWVHTEAMRGFLPEQVLDRRDKGDFSFLIASLALEQADLFRDVIVPRRTDWVQPDGLASLLAECEPGHVPTKAMWLLCGLFNCDTLFPPN